MSSSYVEGTFEEYAKALDLLSEEDAEGLTLTRDAILELGLAMSAGEVAIRLRILKPSQVARILAEINKDLELTVKPPAIRRIDPEKEKATRNSLDTAELKACLKIKVQAKQLGIALTVTEILKARPQKPLRQARSAGSGQARSTSSGQAQGRPARRERPDRAPQPKPKKSNGLLIGISIGAFALVAVIVTVIMSGGSCSAS